MKIFGIDFTSAPRPGKPITCAHAVFKKDSGLVVETIEALEGFEDFEAFLKRKGAWWAGMDLPFGLPAPFLQAVKLPDAWPRYVRAVARMEKEGFEKKIRQYQKKRAKGDKEPLRLTDVWAEAKSPLKLVRPPVGKMFFEAAPRLLKAGVSVPPLHANADRRIVVEAYPALIARRFAGKYKSDNNRGGASEEKERKAIIKGIRSAALAAEFGFPVRVPPKIVRELIADASGDRLDAVLCAVQAAWAYVHKKPGNRLPGNGHPLIQTEGWIADPRLQAGVPVSLPRKARNGAGRTEKNDAGKFNLMNQVQRLSDIGRALSGELHLNSLLDVILKEARTLTGADGGTLYTLEKNALHFKIVQNDTLGIHMGGRDGEKIPFPPVELDESNVSAYVALHGVPFLIPDVYKFDQFDFTGPRKFDERENYRTQSMLVVPLRDPESKVIGVLQLLNARDPKNRVKVVPFSPESQRLVESLASQASVAIRNAKLVSDLQGANFELIHARDKALEASRAKSSFLANMSHELRTPMNAIIGYSEMLAEDARDQGLEEFESDLEKINTAGKHLLALINDILDLSKIEAGKMEINLEVFSIADLVREVVETIQPLAEKNNNQLILPELEALGNMNADIVRVKQMLFNLMSNACKFTENGTIELKILREMQDDVEWIRFHISDTGIGISPFELKKLFSDFSQIDPSNARKFGGTGLGLAISRRFCRMMGGDITVQSKLGKGSTFSIQLPATVTRQIHPMRRATDFR